MIPDSAQIGKDAILGLRDLLFSIRPKTIFLIRGGKSFIECGAESEIIPIIKSLNAELISFSDFTSNPKIEDVRKGLDIINEIKPDIILAVGGGSAIDMAKLIRFFYSYSEESGVYTQINPKIPLAAIPTTAGTGCETTHFAVMYVDGVKNSVEHEAVRPDYAFVYPPFTYHNSPYLTACTGFDALAQAIESFWNKHATQKSDELAKEAIRLLWSNLPIAVNNPTEASRDAMSIGSYLAGKAIDITKTTAPHAFSYPFTSHYGYPHGHAVALVFPEIAEYNFINGNIPMMKINYLSEILNTTNKDMKACLTALNQSIGLTLLSNIDYDINLIVGEINTSRLSNNPAKINDACSKRLLANILRDGLTNCT